MTTLQLEEQNPVPADFVVDQNWAVRYTDKAHATWENLLDSMKQISAETTCSKFVQGQKAVKLDAKRIPKFKDVSEQLADTTGWEIVGVNGFVPNEIFFTHFANKRFPVSCDIRSLDGSQFEEYPDLFHDIYGHTPLLIYPEVSDILQASAIGILKAMKHGREDLMKKIVAAYWFTLEVGLVKEQGDIRVYGAASASSQKETMHAMQSKSPNLIRFDFDRVMRTEYDMLDLQQTYFVLDDIADLRYLADQDFFERALRLENKATLGLGEICESDEIIQLGTISGYN